MVEADSEKEGKGMMIALEREDPALVESKEKSTTRIVDRVHTSRGLTWAQVVKGIQVPYGPTQTTRQSVRASEDLKLKTGKSATSSKINGKHRHHRSGRH